MSSVYYAMDDDSKMQKHSQILDLVIFFLFSAATVPLLDGNVSMYWMSCFGQWRL